MRRVGILWIILITNLGLAQLTFENPKHLNFPEQRARLLLRMSCRSVATELHIRESSINLNMHLVLGEKDEHFGYDSHTGAPTLYLQEWNERKFVIASLKFAIQRSIDQRRQEQMMVDVLRHCETIAPISMERLEASTDSTGKASSKAKNDCLSAIGNARVRKLGCNSDQNARAR